MSNRSAGGDDRRTHADAPVEAYRWLRSVVENSSDNVTVVDLDGTLRYASPAFGRMLGYDAEEVVGAMNVLDHVHPEDLRLVLEETEKALSEGGVTTNKAEYRFRHKDGSWRWVESVGTYLHEDPDVQGVVVQTRDITERKEAEEALRRSEAEIFSVLESITDGFFALDREWRFTYVNHQARVLLNRSSEVLVGEKIWEDPTFYPQYRKAVAEGKTVRFEGYYPPLGKWYSVRAYPSGSGLSVYFQDITDRKETEARLHFQAQLLGAVGEAVIALDLEGKVIYWNRVAEEIYGRASEEVMGRILKEMVVPGHLRKQAEDIAAQLREGRKWTGEFVVRHKDGTTFPVEGTDTPIFGEDGELAGVIGVLRKVTERKEAEEALKESERRYATLLSNEPALVYRCLNEPAWPQVFVSDYALELTGYPPEDLLIGGGVSYGELIVEKDRQRVWEEVQEALAERRRFKLHYSIRRRDGHLRHVEEYGQGIFGEDGEVEALEGLIYDVTGAVRQEKALKEAEERYRTLVEQMPAVTYIDKATDGPDEPVYTSPQIEKLLGYSADE